MAISRRQLAAQRAGACRACVVAESGFAFRRYRHGVYVSRNGGATWDRFRGGLPPAPVHDLVLHPRERELVVATHGRGIYVINVAPMEELTTSVAREPAHLFDARPVKLRTAKPSPGLAGGKMFAVPNPPAAASIWYHLPDAVTGPVSVQITDAVGNVVAELPGVRDAGMHCITWDLRPPTRRGNGPASPIKPGDYAVRLKVGDKALVRPLRIDAAYPGMTGMADDGPDDP